MSLSTRLIPASYRGTGDGVESGPFEATIDVVSLPGGSISVGYRAVAPKGSGSEELHREHTVVSAGFDGRDRLYIAHDESAFVTVMVETQPGSQRFEMLEPFGPYTLAIEVGTPSDTTLTWAWHWAAVGDEPVEQSCATVERLS